MQPYAIFNVVEAVFWLVLAAIVATRARSAHPSFRLLGYIVSVAFLAFAGTDLVEVKTGAWYRPWWLLGYNVACLAVILGCYVKYLSVRKVLAAEDATEQVAEAESTNARPRSPLRG
jgi:hypothetical protein